MFDPWQQVFTISMLANGEAKVTGKTATELQQQLAATLHSRLKNPAFQALIGSSWEIVWGPCVFQNRFWGRGSGVADNAMFVARNTASHLHVVAIAATNFHSIFDMFKEDAAVNPILPWPYGQTLPPGLHFPADVHIAPGTSRGVDLLQNMKDANRSLAAFLQSIQSTSATLVFTGHSLGGALAPTLACALITQGNLNPANWKNVYVFPTAGPTPGNGQFVTLFQSLFPQSAAGAKPWQIWNSLIWNSLDIVPHAWNTTTLSQIENLYAPKVRPHLQVLDLLRDAERSAKDQGYQQLPSNGALAGTFVPLGELHERIMTLFVPFLAEALYQHIGAYFGLLAVQDLQPLLKETAVPLQPTEKAV
jgi:hypothetical protein